MRFAQRQEAAELQDHLVTDIKTYTVNAATLASRGFTYQQAKRLLREWTDYQLDDDSEAAMSFDDFIADQLPDIAGVIPADEKRLTKAQLRIQQAINRRS